MNNVDCYRYNECIRTDKEKYCYRCSNNEALPEIGYFFQAYKPVCPKGYDDCISDPAYILYKNPKWYKELFGDLTPEKAAEKHCNDEECYYDDEDK